MSYRNALGQVEIDGRIFLTVDGYPITTTGPKASNAITNDRTPSGAELDRARIFLRGFAIDRSHYVSIGGTNGLSAAARAATEWWSPRSVPVGAIIHAAVSMGFDLTISESRAVCPTLGVRSGWRDVARESDDVLGMVGVHAREDAES